jgi:hypothetical protein
MALGDYSTHLNSPDFPDYDDMEAIARRGMTTMRDRLPDLTTETLAREVRRAWVAFCVETGDDKPSHLVPWDELGEWDREADRRIADAIARPVHAWYADQRQALVVILRHQPVVDALVLGCPDAETVAVPLGLIRALIGAARAADDEPAEPGFSAARGMLADLKARDERRDGDGPCVLDATDAPVVRLARPPTLVAAAGDGLDWGPAVSEGRLGDVFGEG